MPNDECGELNSGGPALGEDDLGTREFYAKQGARDEERGKAMSDERVGPLDNQARRVSE